jgi:hypothetical protein
VNKHLYIENYNPEIWIMFLIHISKKFLRCSAQFLYALCGSFAVLKTI